MTWDQMNKKYGKEGRVPFLTKKDNPEPGNNWKNIMDSTNKLLWLFMISNESDKRILTMVLDKETGA